MSSARNPCGSRRRRAPAWYPTVLKTGSLDPVTVLATDSTNILTALLADCLRSLVAALESDCLRGARAQHGAQVLGPDRSSGGRRQVQKVCVALFDGERVHGIRNRLS